MNNTAYLQHSINWYKAGGSFDVEHFVKVLKAKKMATPLPRNKERPWFLAIQKTVCPPK